MNSRGWVELLLEATEDVKRKVDGLEAGAGSETIGVGASGDKTLKADKAAEDVLLGALRKRGEVRILSEEAGAVGMEDAKTLAVVDPLDGSSNFERGIPFYCTSVALVDGNGVDGISVGVIRDLVSGDVFSAVRGEGAAKNGHPIKTSRVTDVWGAVVGIDVSRATPALAESLAPLLTGAKRQVHFGANALELCYLADGRLDAFVDTRGLIRITDFAAAYLIASEAGARFSGPGGSPLKAEFDLRHKLSFIASANEALHKEILNLSAKRG